MAKKVLITGASSGIGEATAYLFASLGYELFLNARREEKLYFIIKNIEQKYNVKCHSLVFDVRNKDEVFSVLNQYKIELKDITVLINNAGLAKGLSELKDGKIDHWEQMIDTNLKGLLYVSKFISLIMSENKNGHIVNIGSIAGKSIYANGNVYCASKHAVDAITQSMRLELAKYNVKVTGIHPGAVETEFSVVRYDGDKEKAKSVYVGYENLVANDIAEAILWCVNRPAHVTINDLVIMPTAQPMAGVIIKDNL